MDVVTILSTVSSLLDRLGITPYIQAYLIAVIAVGLIASVYARFHK